MGEKTPKKGPQKKSTPLGGQKLKTKKGGLFNGGPIGGGKISTHTQNPPMRDSPGGEKTPGRSLKGGEGEMGGKGGWGR